MQDRMMWIWGSALTAGFMVFAVVMGRQPSAFDAAPAPQAIETPAPPQAKQWTKAEFDTAAYGLTKAQIRAKFGPPDNVIDSEDTWYYWHLPVYDDTAGIQVRNTAIRFEGIAGSGDSVASVRYP